MGSFCPLMRLHTLIPGRMATNPLALWEDPTQRAPRNLQWRSLSQVHMWGKFLEKAGWVDSGVCGLHLDLAPEAPGDRREGQLENGQGSRLCSNSKENSKLAKFRKMHLNCTYGQVRSGDLLKEWRLSTLKKTLYSFCFYSMILSSKTMFIERKEGTFSIRKRNFRYGVFRYGVFTPELQYKQPEHCFCSADYLSRNSTILHPFMAWGPSLWWRLRPDDII